MMGAGTAAAAFGTRGFLMVAGLVTFGLVTLLVVDVFFGAEVFAVFEMMGFAAFLGLPLVAGVLGVILVFAVEVIEGVAFLVVAVALTVVALTVGAFFEAGVLVTLVGAALVVARFLVAGSVGRLISVSVFEISALLRLRAVVLEVIFPADWARFSAVQVRT